MSRTRHHRAQKHRHRGHDLWSRRQYGDRQYSAEAKAATRRAERSAEARMLYAELADPWWIGLAEEIAGHAAWAEEDAEREAREAARDAREQRLQAAGFDPVSAEQRAANLAVTLMYL